MPIVRGLVTQGGADTFTAATIDTGLTVDGKSGWLITGFHAFWSDGYTAAAADMVASAVLATQATVTVMSDDEEIARVTWAVANTAGVAVTYPLDLVKSAPIFGERVTVQPNIYVHSSTTTTGLTNDMYYVVEYEIVKMSDLEVMRLLVGGA